MPDASPAACTRRCVLQLASRYALITKEKVYVLEGPWQAIAAAAGTEVRVRGVLNGETIKASKVDKL